MSAFQVTGEIDGTPYTVEVTGKASKPVVGSKRIRALVREHVGDTIALSPTGPTVTVDPADASSVLVVLGEYTTVAGMSGDVPDLRTPRRHGGVS